MSNYKEYRLGAKGRPIFVVKDVEEGVDVEMPKILPADVVLDVLAEVREKEKAAKRGEGDQWEDLDFLLGVGERIAGEEKWAYLRKHIEIMDLLGLTRAMLRHYAFPGFGEEDEAQGKEQPEAKEESPSIPSSITSEPSTQTSNGTTRTADEPSGQESLTGESSPVASPISPPIHSS